MKRNKSRKGRCNRKFCKCAFCVLCGVAGTLEEVLDDMFERVGHLNGGNAVLEQTVLGQIGLAKFNAEIQEAQRHFLGRLAPYAMSTVGNNCVESL